MKVLIADDNMISRRLLEAALLKWDYEVVAACDGAEAWEELQKPAAPRIAILDWMMPGLSGPEVCHRVRQLPNEHYTYILLVTSRSEKEDVIAGMEAGADDYLTKPFDQSEFKVRLGPAKRIIELQDALLEVQAALRKQATTDALTGLWNRRSILETLEREIARTARGSSPLGVVIADVDRFKAVNDTHGHLAGDAVLRELASRMKSSCRQYDSVGRYGGEEFLLILPGCDGDAAECQAQRMRLEIERKPLELSGATINFTCSFGVTSVPAGVSARSEAVIRVADAALYQAKDESRNRVTRLPFHASPADP